MTKVMLMLEAGYEVPVDPDEVEAVLPSTRWPGATFVVTSWERQLGFVARGKSNDVMKKLFTNTREEK